jgi:hypothetical protein
VHAQRTVGVRLLCLAALTLAVAGCGSEAQPAAAPQPAGYRAHGLAVDLPPGWEPARESLTPTLSDPRERFAVATYPLRYRRIGCDHMPSSALADLGDGDAFVTVQERGRADGADWSGFPQRPAHFGPTEMDSSEAPECVPGTAMSAHWLPFSAGGRHFYALLAFGPHTPAARREQAWAILDSLAVDPDVQPQWRLGG